MPEFKTVAELLAVPERWTQGGMARDADGCWTSPTSSEAVRWCLSGAMTKVYGKCNYARWSAVNSLHDAIKPSFDFISFNDYLNRTHAEVLAVVQKAGI